MLEDGAVPLPEDVPQILGRRPAGRVVLAHVAQPPGELGDALAVARLALPLDRQVAGLDELRPGNEGDAGLAEDVHGGRLKSRGRRSGVVGRRESGS